MMQSTGQVTTFATSCMSFISIHHCLATSETCNYLHLCIAYLTLYSAPEMHGIEFEACRASRCCRKHMFPNLYSSF